MNIVSACCGASIVQGVERHYPLGGTVWGENFLIDACANCGKEAEPVHTCGNCGEELNGDNPEVRIDGEEQCHICLAKDKAKIARLLRIQAAGLQQIAEELEQGQEISFWRVDFDIRDYQTEIEQFEKRGVGV